jgi:dihydrofolate reductase (trimethoprim resistance protein)
MIIVGAMAANRVIGSGDGMPWDVPEEYAHFLRLIEGQTIIIGRRSYEIFGASLTSAHNVVVSRAGGDIAGAVVARTIEDALRMATSFGGTFFSAGGASIYAQTIPLADTMYLSYIKGQFTGDAYFPEFSEQEWVVEKREDHPRFEFVVYRRTSPWNPSGGLQK